MSKHTSQPAQAADTGSEAQSSQSEQVGKNVEQETVTDTQQWKSEVILTVALIGLGIAVASPVVTAAATVPLWYVVAAAVTGTPEVTFAAKRRLTIDDETGVATAHDEPLSGSPGAVVSVTTTIRNNGSEPAVDFRAVDGVPETLPVVEGTPRVCASLAPGEQTTLEYSVELQRGEYTFTAPRVRVRDLAGATQVELSVTSAGARTVLCSPRVEQPLLQTGHANYPGEGPTSMGGDGVEFHAVRDYEPGDPKRSIDWRRYANTRDLATVEYATQRSTRTLCVVDARTCESHSPAASELSVVELSAGAAERTAERLFEMGHPTGAASLYRRIVSIVPPETGTTVRDRVARFFEQVPTDESASNVVARTLHDEPGRVISQTVQERTQVVLFSSFSGDLPVKIVKQLRSRGHEVCVVSPISAETTSRPSETRVSGETRSDSKASVERLSLRLNNIDHDRRLTEAQAYGAAVVRWDLNQPLDLALNSVIQQVKQK